MRSSLGLNRSNIVPGHSCLSQRGPLLTVRAPPLALMFPQEASGRRCADGCLLRHSEAKAGVSRRPVHQSRGVGTRSIFSQRERGSAFTLLELLIVVGIIVVLLVLIAPRSRISKLGRLHERCLWNTRPPRNARTYAKANTPMCL